jgi:sugar lactone lactonase YvrE
MTTTTGGVARACAAGILVALACAAAAQAPAQSQGGFVERFKASTKAYETKDYVRMEAELREALKLRPAHPTATYNLAAAQALRGDGEGAVDTLEQLADMGLWFDPGADADFASLKDARGFKSVRRAFAGAREPRGAPARAFRLLSPSFIPEGIAYDRERKHFFVGSVHERRIQRVLRDDTEREFTAAGLWAVLGMAADAERRLLWVTTAAVPEMKGAEAAELGRTALLAYDLDSGEARHRFVPDGAGHALGDVAVLEDGTVYASDSKGGVLYRLDAKAGALVPVTRPGALSSPQGIAPDRREKGLYVADYTQGLYWFDLKTQELTRVEAARKVSLYGIDGLARYGDELIAIQNGVRPHRVVRLRLDGYGRKVTGASVLAASRKEFDEPTLGVVVDTRFYFVANSQWGKFDAQHRLPPNDQLRRPLVLWLDLEEAAARPPRDPAAPVPRPGPSLPCVPPLC